MAQQWRQGDVLVERIDTLPEEAEPKGDGVLAEGEMTGHAHRLDATSDARVLVDSLSLYIEVGPAGARLVHEEHGPIALDPGRYRVWRQREYDPTGPRNVQD